MYGPCQSPEARRRDRLAALSLLIAALAAGCGPGAAGGLAGYDGVMIGGTERETVADDWGDGWLPERPVTAPGGTASARSGATTNWSLVLETFAQPGHQAAAANMLGELAKVSPELAAARVHTTAEGSMVVYGRYQNPQDAAAQRDLAWIKSVKLQGRPVFPRAMLTRIRKPAPPRSLHPFLLRAARLRYPKVDPLYTMEVAVWGDFGSGKLTLQEIQKAAEGYCHQLRTQGLEAYFHHDADKQLSSVTVGLFDRRAIDARSGFYSAEVEAMFRRFPAHLVNGEPLQELIDRDRPHLGTKVQTPRLVIVPK